MGRRRSSAQRGCLRAQAFRAGGREWFLILSLGEIQAEPAGVPGQPEGSAAALAGAVIPVVGNPAPTARSCTDCGALNLDQSRGVGRGGGGAEPTSTGRDIKQSSDTRGAVGTAFTNGFEPS